MAATRLNDVYLLVLLDLVLNKCVLMAGPSGNYRYKTSYGWVKC